MFICTYCTQQVERSWTSSLSCSCRSCLFVVVLHFNSHKHMDSGVGFITLCVEFINVNGAGVEIPAIAQDGV